MAGGDRVPAEEGGEDNADRVVGVEGELDVGGSQGEGVGGEGGGPEERAGEDDGEGGGSEVVVPEGGDDGEEEDVDRPEGRRAGHEQRVCDGRGCTEAGGHRGDGEGDEDDSAG